MKKLNFLLIGAFMVLTALSSCQKSTAIKTNDAAILAVGAIQVSLAGTTTLTTTTSGGTITSTPVITSGIFIVNCYGKGDVKDSLTFASLPTSIGTYLTANYPGYTFQKGFKISSSAGVLNSYVTVITFNGKPVGLKFDASGNFVLVFEQREGHDLGDGPGWHEGGCFGGRDGHPLDTIAISALPVIIKTFITANYPTDTLLHVAVNFDATYTVISENKILFATTFTSGGTFVARIQVYARPEVHANIIQSALPAAINTYLTITFPGYVFGKAFSEKQTGIIQGYVVLITANNTREAIAFDANGVFIKSVVLR